MLLSSSSPPILHLKSPFLNGLPPIRLATTTLPFPSMSSPSTLTVKAMRSLTGKVVCNTNDKTVAVEVVRLAPHPKYKRRVRHKKKYQAHDPLNQFQVGDIVQLEKGRPISKNKTFWAVPAPNRNGPRVAAKVEEEAGPTESGQS